MVTAVGGVGGGSGIDPAGDWLYAADDAGPLPSGLDRLLTGSSALDRLIADAGPLGKFRVDMEGALPSGTSAFTIRLADTLVRALARVTFPGEGLLAATPQLAARAPAEACPTEAAPPVRDISDRLQDPRPAISSEPRFAAHHRPFATPDGQPG